MKSSDLIRRARRAGIQTSFVDSSGHQREASPDTLAVLLKLLGEQTIDEHSLPPVIVCWNGKAKRIAIKAVDGTRERRKLERRLPLVPREKVISSAARQTKLEARLTHATDGSANLHIPSLPPGYYELRHEQAGIRTSTLILSAPGRAFGDAKARDWGVFVPMYALHSSQSWGAGNLTDWQHLCEWLAGLGNAAPARHGTPSGAPVAATLPLLGAFLDDWKCEPSPYSPATRLFWNEFYLDVTRTPEFAASSQARRLRSSAPFKNALGRLRQESLVNYAKEMRLKRKLLDAMAAEFFAGRSPRRAEFDAFVRERPEANRYARFRSVCEGRAEPWSSWPARLRNGQLQPTDCDPAAERYHLFAQWLVQEQVDDVLARCEDLGVKFYLDLPLGVNPDGYDVWAHQNLFVNGASVGAPPDGFFTKGQDWGFPPLHPHRIREDGYRYVIDYLRFQMRHTGLLRLDHVMGLHRLWWVPSGGSAADGAYVNYNAEELYAVLCLESHRHQTALIGENLGTVPPAVNTRMRRHGIRTMYVAQYEAQPDARKPLRAPGTLEAASLNTHDMPMWAAFWDGLDIDDRRDLGLLTVLQARKEQQHRRKLRAALTRFLQRKKVLPKTAGTNSGAVLAALLRWIGKSDAALALVNLEDLWLETKPQNTPGTSTERINWRRKLSRSIETIRNSRNARGLLELLSARRQGQ